MNDTQSSAPAPSPVASLALAVRKARVDVAQHAEAVAELRGAENARLEMLGEALKPVLAQVPAHVDLFDAGLAPGEHPRYFIDMLGFVEMARDRRTYRFLQDTRHGRVVIKESDHQDEIVDAVTAYVARRLVEREQALASDQTIEQAARAYAARSSEPMSGKIPAAPQPASTDEVPPEAKTPAKPGWFRTALLFTLEFLGAIVLISLLLGLGWLAWQIGAHQWAIWNNG